MDGFLASDVREILSTGANPKTFNQSGTKTVPNVQEIKINAKTFDISGVQISLLGRFIKDGYSLPKHDVLLYYCNVFLFRQDLLDAIGKALIYELDGITIKRDVQEIILAKKMEQSIASAEEKKQYSDFLKNRKDERMKEVCNQLGVSENVIENLYVTNKQSYTRLLGSMIMFETETIAYLDPAAVIYWDYPRFIHIFLRHNKDFTVDKSTKGQGTLFQYTQRDIHHVLEILLRQNKDAIVEKLKSGKEFSENRIYFNGNYYQIRIAKDGLPMQFHPTI